MKFIKIPKIINLERFIKNKTAREWVEALIFAIIVATIFRTWLFSPFRVPTGSMIPTILEGDHLFANMHYYGYVVPFANKKIIGDTVQRGDIAIFPNPQNPKKCDNSLFYVFDTVKSLIFGLLSSSYVPTCIDYVKRIVALEGDHIEMVGEKVYINGKPEKGYTPYFNPFYPALNIYHSETVPKGHVFALGDNRRNSHDGRFWLNKPNSQWGYIKKENVRARVMFIYLSIEKNKSIFTGIRFERMFMELK